MPRINYFYRVPSGAVHREPDGHLYAWVGATVTENGVRECKERKVKADDCLFHNGEGYVWIGSMGEAIAQRVNLPFAVTYSEAKASLIADAPALLDALRWALEQLDDSLDPDYRQAFDAATALVARHD